MPNKNAQKSRKRTNRRIGDSEGHDAAGKSNIGEKKAHKGIEKAEKHPFEGDGFGQRTELFPNDAFLPIDDMLILPKTEGKSRHNPPQLPKTVCEKARKIAVVAVKSTKTASLSRKCRRRIPYGYKKIGSATYGPDSLL